MTARHVARTRAFKQFLAASMLACASIGAAADPATTCTVSKRKAAGNAYAGALGCVAKAAGVGASIDPQCTAVQQQRLVTAFAKAEGRGGCASVGDAGVVGVFVDACVGRARASLAVGGDPVPRSSCAAAKLKAAGKALTGGLGCHATALTRARPVDPACLAKASARLTSSIGRADLRSDCVTGGDAASLDAMVTDCVAVVMAVVARVTTTTTTTTTSTTLQPAAVCTRWNADRADRAEGVWSGNAATCTAGDMSAHGRANALKMVNLYRWLAGMPAVASDDSKNAAAQQCALMMHANGTLNHMPPASWRCYSAAGALGAASSTLAGLPAVLAVDANIEDIGNAATLGHRRWLLSNTLGPMTIGSTSAWTCLWVTSGTGDAQVPWTAWPPPGDVPIQAIRGTSPAGSVDSTGWSFHSDTIDLSNASVSVRDGTTNLQVTKTTLAQFYGSTWAIRFVPRSWTTQAGHTYRVTLSGISPPLTYSVRVVDCGG